MSRRKLLIKMKLPVLVLLVVLFGCSSPLMETIEEEVEIIQTPPSITSVYPVNGASGVSIEDEIQIIFTKNIQESSVTGSTFIIVDEYGNSTTGSYIVSSDSVTFSPNKLFYNTVYTLTATSGILDQDGNAFSSDYTWSFTTQTASANVKPNIVSFVINQGKSATSSTDIEMEFAGVNYLGGTTGLEIRYRNSTDSDWSSWLAMEDGLKIVDVTLPVSGTEDEEFLFYSEVRDEDKAVSPIRDALITYKTSPPEIDVDFTYPPPDSNDSPGNLSYIKVQFNSEMDPTTINDSTVYVARGTTQITTYEFEFLDDMNGVEFTSFNDGVSDYDFEPYTDYTVFIDKSVSDVAGNDFGSDFTYSFRTGGINDLTAPEGIIALNLEEPDINALSGSTFDLEIKAVDDYNNVRAVKFWGDNDGTGFPTFESEAIWYLYSETDGPNANGDTYMRLSDIPGTTPFNFSAGWDIPTTDRDYYIYYRFIDYANNETAVPGILRISRDGSSPVLNGIQLGNGSGYSNTELGAVNIIIDAEDHGSGLESLWIMATATDTSETVPAAGDPQWAGWASLLTNYELPDAGEGEYHFWIAVKDFVDNTTPAETDPAYHQTLIIDNTKPSVDFTGIEILNVNSLAQQNVNISDPIPSDGGGNDMESGIATYEWEQISGPGTLQFYSDSAGTISDNTVQSPFIKASTDDGSEDGMYEIIVTATDNAGNSSFYTTNFSWDTTAPDEIGLITAFNEDGSQLTTSGNGTLQYTPSAQPYATWPASEGADFYIIIPWPLEFDPNSEPDPVAQHDEPGFYPHWDDDEVDWDNPATYEDYFYIRQDNPFLSAPAPDSPGQNDGPVYLYVTAWDNAGNRSNKLSDQMVKFHIDTLPPVVNVLKDLPPSNSSLTIDFHTGDNAGDGRVYDQKTPDDPVDPESGPTQSGSDIASYFWEQVSGSGDLTIGNATSLTPSVYGANDGSEDDEYVLRLTATDRAGNIGEGYIGFIWDTTAPEPVYVNGPAHTPDRTPTWSWSTGGGGNGSYEYQLETESGTVVTSWTSTTNTYFTPATNLTDDQTYVLYVREYDDAGNYSNELSSNSSHAIWVDTSYKTAPTVSLSGAYLRNADNRTVTWSMGSGIGEPATEYYRYWIENSSGAAVMYNSGASANVIGPFGSGTASDSVNLSSLDDGVYTIRVQEYDSVNYIYSNEAGWSSTTGYIGSSTVQIDATAPIKPTISSNTTGYYLENNNYHLTNDTTPYLRWSSGGGGNGSYRWSFDESNWTYTTSIYVYPSLAEGTYTFYVQERDVAGNWSDSTEYNFEIDTTAPTLTSILLENRSTSAYNTTSYTVSRYVDIDITGSGSNTVTYPAGDIRRIVYWNAGGTEYNIYVSGTVTDFSGWDFATNGGSTADGTKYVYCKLYDYAGNVSVVRSDGIVLDTEPPPVTSFTINSGATTTTSASVTLNSTLTADAYAMRISTDNGATWSGWYGDSTAKAWTLETAHGYNGYGAKKIMVQFTDIAGYYCRNNDSGSPNYQLAGHDTDVTDSIFYGTPIIKYASKGQYSNGAIYVNYEDFEDFGDSYNTYYIYYSTTPGGTKYQKGTTTSYNQYYSNTWTKGTLYYITIRVYNPDIGWSNYSSETFGFSSNVTVLYDSADTTDTSTANYIKTVLQKDLPALYSSSISGTNPTWTVTVVPEDLVSSTYDGFGYNLIYGDPIIITPSAGDLYQNTNKARNIVESNKGVVAMGFYGGLKFLETVSNNWVSWGYPASTSTFTLQRPDEISYGNTYTYVTGMYYMYTWRYGNNVWTYPLTSTSIPTTTYEDQTQIGYSSAPINERGLYRSGRTNPTNGYLLGRSMNYTDRFPVVQQGRFLYYGYDGLWTRPYTGWAYWVNLIARMDNY